MQLRRLRFIKYSHKPNGESLKNIHNDTFIKLHCSIMMIETYWIWYKNYDSILWHIIK